MVNSLLYLVSLPLYCTCMKSWGLLLENQYGVSYSLMSSFYDKSFVLEMYLIGKGYFIHNWCQI